MTETVRLGWRWLIPSALTVVRPFVGLACGLAAFLGNGTLAAWLYLMGCLTDVGDGLLARRLNVQTARGQRLDGLADTAFHTLVGVGLAGWAVRDEVWWVLVVLAALALAERAMRRWWIGVHTVFAKIIAGIYRVVMFALLVSFASPSARPTLIGLGFIVLIATYTYEGAVTLREMREGRRRTLR